MGLYCFLPVIPGLTRDPELLGLEQRELCSQSLCFAGSRLKAGMTDVVLET